MPPKKEHKQINGIEIKQCYRCQEWLELQFFYKSSNCWDDLDRQCKLCHKDSCKKWRNNNLENARFMSKRWRENNIEKARALCLDWHRRNPEKGREQRTRWARDNYEKRKINHRVIERNKRKINPLYRLHQSVSTSIRQFLREGKAGKNWERITGYSLNELKAHLEQRFKLGMTWANYGKWHIDHIIPISSFSINEVGKCWALENLQPLWAKENILKGARIDVLVEA